MSTTQANLIADLRYPAESRNPGDEKWSQWRSLSMIELSAMDTYRFVHEMIPHPAQKVLEIGCGNGYLSLELARNGHQVIGIDTSQEIIEMAKRTRAAHADTPGFGELTYECADIRTWEVPENSFDIVLVNRTFHHLHHLQSTIEKVKHLLKQNGHFICQDYAYDRLDEQTATWMYTMQRLLFLSGMSDEDPATTENEAHSIEALQAAWYQKSDNRLNRYEEMHQAFQAHFQEQLSSWFPYLFVYIGNGIHASNLEQEHSIVTFLKNMECHLIEKGAIQAVGFRYVGEIQKKHV